MAEKSAIDALRSTYQEDYVKALESAGLETTDIYKGPPAAAGNSFLRWLYNFITRRPLDSPISKIKSSESENG